MANTDYDLTDEEINQMIDDYLLSEYEEEDYLISSYQDRELDMMGY